MGPSKRRLIFRNLWPPAPLQISFLLPPLGDVVFGRFLLLIDFSIKNFSDQIAKEILLSKGFVIILLK